MSELFALTQSSCQQTAPKTALTWRPQHFGFFFGLVLWLATAKFAYGKMGNDIVPHQRLQPTRASGMQIGQQPKKKEKLNTLKKKYNV